ncbi:MAG: type II toxin-antitoxin system PemK/MazF family toxin [Cyclobacteriaceae bacterium]
MKYEQGDIVLIPFPFTDLSQSKKRPAIILTNEKSNTQGDYLLVQVTSKSNFDLILELKEADYKGHSLPVSSYVRYNKIFCLSEKLIEKKISAVTKAFSIKINAQIAAIIDR